MGAQTTSARYITAITSSVHGFPSFKAQIQLFYPFIPSFVKYCEICIYRSVCTHQSLLLEEKALGQIIKQSDKLKFTNSVFLDGCGVLA